VAVEEGAVVGAEGDAVIVVPQALTVSVRIPNNCQ